MEILKKFLYYEQNEQQTKPFQIMPEIKTQYIKWSEQPHNQLNLSNRFIGTCTFQKNKSQQNWAY